ncbi:amino acid ABC transporter permease [Nordella sp. HKS 07]|uniref:amino acid ABC transporter permease n=1 Tax=Nordella sp. HKS 07 TaxID=2712222 RepID=UPI0019D0A568|nr:amino acid ABC transporter permease [Nordella sp. HKS 07]
MSETPLPEAGAGTVPAPTFPKSSDANFRLRVIAVWATLFVLFVFFFLSFDLKFSFILEKLPFLTGLTLTRDGFLQGAALTLFVCFFAIIASIILGFISALGRLSRNPVFYGISTFYTSFFRGTPLLVQIFLIYLGLPQLGPVPAAVPSGIIALSLNYGAYLSEIFRSGIMSVPKGQREAGASLGLHQWVVMWRIVLPQAMRVVIPPTGSQFISMLKDSSLISVMGVWEIMFLAQSFGRTAYRYIEMLTTAAVIYWILSICFEIVQARLEAHYGKGFKERH